MTKEDFLKAVFYLFRETFEGSPEGQPSAYLDRGVGIFGTLTDLSAADVSKEINSTTIAAHTEHFKFYLDRLCEYINGRTEPVNWEQSWLIEDVNEEEWKALLDSVKKSYENMLRCLAEVENWNESQAGMVLGMLAHTAYHLGAIRQLAKRNLITEDLKRAGFTAKAETRAEVMQGRWFPPSPVIRYCL